MKQDGHPSSRRGLIFGDWQATRSLPATRVEIVSLIVNAWPEHLSSVEADIIALGGAEVHARDHAKGKLIVVLEAPTQGEIGARTNTICGLPHVLSAVMVFQGSDEGQEVA